MGFINKRVVNSAMNAILKSFFLCLAAVALLGCGSSGEIKDPESLEYMQSRLSKPVVYPKGTSAPKSDNTFAVPDLPAKLDRKYDLNQLIRPPSLLGALKPTPKKTDRDKTAEDDEDS